MHKVDALRDSVVIQIVNSTYGRRGQIGYRTQFIKQALDQLGVENMCLARDRGAGGPGVVPVLPFGQMVPRILNAYRMFVSPRFNHRVYDVRYFEAFAMQKIRRALKQRAGRPVLVHLWEYSPRIISLAKGMGAKVILEVPIAPSHETLRLQQQGLTMDSPIEKVDEREDAALRQADMLLSPSEYVTGILTRIGIDSAKVRTNPFGCCVLDQRERSLDPDHLNVLFVGTLSRRKGLPQLLAAWDKAGLTQDQLILCGRVVKSVKRLLQEIERSHIETPGFVDTAPFLARSDVFVFPTWMEGSAKAVYEAMAAGLPVITTPNAGSIVENGVDGLLVPPGDAEALARALRYFKEHPEKIAEFGRRGREKAVRYTWPSYGERVLDAYRRLLTGEISA